MPLNKQVLVRFGLHSIEIDCYLALLSLGSGTVSDVAKRIEKNRSLVYFHLRHLKDRGFIEESRRKRILRYVPKSANEVLAIIQGWTDDFRVQIPLLESLGRIQKETPTIEVQESKQGFYGILREISQLPNGSTWRVMEGRTAMHGEINLLSQQEFEQWFRWMVAKRIKTKGIFTDTSLTAVPSGFSPANQDLIKKRIWDVRVVPERVLPFQDILCIYGDTVSFVFPDTQLTVSVKHQRISQALQIMFDGLFNQGKPRTSPLEE